jgi:hypothetical protein
LDLLMKRSLADLNSVILLLKESIFKFHFSTKPWFFGYERSHVIDTIPYIQIDQQWKKNIMLWSFWIPWIWSFLVFLWNWKRFRNSNTALNVLAILNTISSFSPALGAIFALFSILMLIHNDCLSDRDKELIILSGHNSMNVDLLWKVAQSIRLQSTRRCYWDSACLDSRVYYLSQLTSTSWSVGFWERT